MRMAHLKGIFRWHDLFFAQADTQKSGVRYWMECPLRSDAQETFQALYYIRSCSGGEVTRAEGLHLMKLAAKELQDEEKVEKRTKKLATKDDTDETKAGAKAATSGYIKAVGADSHYARIYCLEKSVANEIRGPRRRSERHAQIDLDK